jgi:NAD-dependent dihydropyrimidine dehydrogenase PreA subunit
MQTLRYLENAVTLSLDADRCTGCRTCTIVCPHGVFAMADKRAVIIDRGACMECGACALNCSAGAIRVTPGVGCAAAIINGWRTGTEPSCGCSGADAPAAAGAPAAATGAAGCGCGDSPAPSGSSCCGEDAAPKRGGGCC